jgi:hypothetical protein
VKHLDEVSQTEEFLSRLKENKVVYDEWIKSQTVAKAEAQDQLDYEELNEVMSVKRVTFNSYKKMITYIHTNGHIPRSTDDESTYARFLQIYRQPAFLLLIKKDEIAWRIFSESHYYKPHDEGQKN